MQVTLGVEEHRFILCLGICRCIVDVESWRLVRDIEEAVGGILLLHPTNDPVGFRERNAKNAILDAFGWRHLLLCSKLGRVEGLTLLV